MWKMYVAISLCTSTLLVHLITFHLYDRYLTLFAGISDACQRHQNENGYKIGIETHATSLQMSLVELM